MSEKFEPGQDVFTDGRDRAAVPPLTVDKINMWENVDCASLVGVIRHGQKVKVLRVETVGGREFCYVSTWLIKGWIPASFLSEEKQEPVGELWPS